MVTIEKIYDKIYTHSLLEDNQVYYYNVVDEKTPHIIGKDIHSVFSPELAIKAHDKVIPLVTLDLGAIAPAYQNKVHFLYHEMVSMDWVITGLNQNDEVSSIYFINYKGERFENDQIKFEDDADGFQEGLDEVKSAMSKLNQKYFTIIKDKTIPADIKFAETDGEKYSSFIHESTREFAKRQEESTGKYQFLDSFGPFTRPIQCGFSYPVIKNSKTPFKFVGQIEASKFGLCDFTYYLFYHPEERIIAQLMQMT